MRCTITLLAISVSIPARAADWVTFRPDGVPVVVSSPRPLEDREHQVTTTVVGSVETEVWQAHDEGNEFTLTSTILPAPALWFSSPASLRERTCKQVAESNGGEMLSCSPYDGGEGEHEVRYVIHGRGGPRYGRARISLLGRRLVVVAVVSARRYSAPAERFLSSLGFPGDGV